MAPKRGREGGGRGGRGSPAPALKRPCRSFDLEIRGRRDQELTNRVEAIETAVTRVQEQTENMQSTLNKLAKLLTSISDRIPGPIIEHHQTPTYKLCFLNSLSDEMFTKKEVRAIDGERIKIRLVVNNQQDVSSHLFSGKVKVVVLYGDFNVDNHKGWTPEEFENHIVRPRNKHGVVLAGELEFKLNNGEAYLQKINFVDNSRFTTSGKFRIGVKLIDNLDERVQEGVTEPFIVKDCRGEANKKNNVPRPDDEVWRLKKIAKNGVVHKKLEENGISSVKHFLRLYYKDEAALGKILSRCSKSVWRTIVDHAKKCDPGSAIYSHFVEDKNIRLYFSSLGQTIGATIADQYTAFRDLDTHLKALVEECRKDAYECITYRKHDYEMYNGQPRTLNCSTFQGLAMPGPKSTEPTDKFVREANQQDTSKGNELDGYHFQQCTFERPRPMPVRTSPSVDENKDISDACLDTDDQLGSDPQIQYDSNTITDSVTLHSPTTGANETVGLIALEQAALTTQGSYPTPFENDGFSLGDWYPDQLVTSWYESSFSPSIQADFPVFSTENNFNMDLLEDLPSDVIAQFCVPDLSKLPSSMGKLRSSCRWVKLMALVKWKAKLRASKRARLTQE